MRPAEVWMLTPPDGKIVACCGALARSGRLRSGDIVFHCSGGLSSSELKAAVEAGASVASVHPLKSFADPRDAVRTFAGTYCAAEGERAALEVLRPAFERIGARVSEIDPQFKTVYHAASVIVCNYLVALMEAGLRCYEKAGIGRETASAMMEPLVRETVDNVFKLGTVKADRVRVAAKLEVDGHRNNQSDPEGPVARGGRQRRQADVAIGEELAQRDARVGRGRAGRARAVRDRDAILEQLDGRLRLARRNARSVDREHDDELVGAE